MSHLTQRISVLFASYSNVQTVCFLKIAGLTGGPGCCERCLRNTRVNVARVLRPLVTIVSWQCQWLDLERF